MFGKLSVVVLQAMPAAVGQPVAPVPAVAAPQRPTAEQMSKLRADIDIVQGDWYSHYSARLVLELSGNNVRRNALSLVSHHYTFCWCHLMRNVNNFNTGWCLQGCLVCSLTLAHLVPTNGI